MQRAWDKVSEVLGSPVIEIATQLRDSCPFCKHGYLHTAPYSEDDREALLGYKLFQILRTKIWGIKKPRSVIQLNLYWAVCKHVAELLSDQNNIFTKRGVDFQIKVRVSQDKPELVQHFGSVDGKTYVALMSTSFANMKHLEACEYYDAAYKLMESMTGVDKDELIKQTKLRMG